MKNFDQLTEIGKKRRVHQAAMEALSYYDLNIVKMRLVDDGVNTIYKLTDASLQQYALKLMTEPEYSIEDQKTELFFVNHLAMNSDITIPEVLKSKSNEQAVTLKTESLQVIISKWLKGRTFDGMENEERFFLLGQMAAKLHQSTFDLEIPAAIKPKKWDRVFYFRDETVVYKDEKYRQYFGNDLKLIENMIEYSDEKMKSYYHMAGLRLVHGDLNPWNVKVNKNELSLLDFGDTIYGLPLHDIAVMLYYYRFNEKFNYEEVKKLCLKGYRSVIKNAEFKEEDLAFLMNTRVLNFTNFVLAIGENPLDYIPMFIRRVKDYIKYYEIKL
ncbi:MAG: phosphotransferase [Clostridia bacterium]|nr:phosphotransferase [Clostridia bacterium]